MTSDKHRFSFAEDLIGYANIKVVGVGGGGGNAGIPDGSPGGNPDKCAGN